ncbi:MAG: DUF5658 family protein [Methanofollis sp.]|nr:DUF5658 family protein [Methanofollis sp.]
MEKKYLLAWLGIAVISLHIADICSTNMVLMLGGQELNPLMAPIVGTDLHVIVKVAAWAFFMAGAIYLERLKTNAGVAYLMGVGLYFMFVVLHNCWSLTMAWM